MIQIPSVSNLKPSFARKAVCTLALAGATLLPMAVSESASALTVGKFNSTYSNSRLRGQSFTPNVLGPDGSGTAPTSGTADLQSMTFALNNPSDRTATTLYLFNALPTVAQADTGTGALFASTGFSDSTGVDPRFGYATRTFTFTGASLDVSTRYFAVLNQDQNLRSGSPGLYTGGGSIYNPGTMSDETSLNLDLAFQADFNPTPVPFAFNPLFGVGGVGLLQIRKAIRKRQQNQQKMLTKA